MRLVVLLFLGIALNSFLPSNALDDDEGEDTQKYGVTFFQFQTKDLPILGGHRRGQFKRDIKRSEVEAPLNNTAADKTNATASLTSNDTAASPANKTAPLNATVSAENATVSSPKENSTAAAAPPASDTNIMNALINLAAQKVNKSSNASETVEANNATVSAVNATSPAANKTKPAEPSTKRSHIMSQEKRNKVLNPNPKPSEQEAALNVKPPKQLENKEHDNVIHSENTTKVDVSEDKHETTTQSVEMIKNPNPVANPSPDNSTSTVQNATTSPAKEEEKPKEEKPSAEDEQAKKIAKDKQTNEEILGEAKKITPVQNTVGSPTNEVKDIMTETSPKTGSARANVHHDSPTDEKTLKHRKKLSEFVPLYHKTTPKDHRLSFQVGSMKHPKHNIHPKCHACPLNSTYRECVKKSTLRECNEGLNNICFTKSTKKDGLITYEMGCSDHNNCVHAKAFPCKDGKDHCFTCCQFDRCNSSPHHGDYELDELNLSELSDAATTASLTDDATGLDTKSGAPATTSSSMALVSTVVVLLFLQL